MGQECPVFSSQREIPADSDILALVELDIKRMRLRIFLARQAIRERLRELDNPAGGNGSSSLNSAEPRDTLNKGSS
jgi:hypothetical protein